MSTKLKGMIDATAKRMRNEKIDKFVKEKYFFLRSKFRKVVTGDDKTRVRDHIVELQDTTENFKLFDKVAFTLGVLNIMMCQFFLFDVPGWFWLFYSFVVSVSLLSRYFYFKSLNWEYFLLDFCYFAVFSNLMHTIFIPNIAWIFRVCYIFSNGPLPWAIIVWRNSFIFHEYDKIFSVYIHILPSMLTYVALTNGHCSLWALLQPSCPDTVTDTVTDTVLQSCSNTLQCSLPAIASVPTLSLTDFAVASALYLAWQAVYYFITEVKDKEFLDKHPEKSTSLRWLASDTKNPLAKFILKQCRRVGLFQPTEEYDARTAKTKIVFMTSQFIYTFITFLPTYVMYRWPQLQLSFIAFVAITSIYNGASFYVEVFAARYESQVVSKTRPYASRIGSGSGAGTGAGTGTGTAVGPRRVRSNEVLQASQSGKQSCKSPSLEAMMSAKSGGRTPTKLQQQLQQQRASSGKEALVGNRNALAAAENKSASVAAAVSESASASASVSDGVGDSAADTLTTVEEVDEVDGDATLVEEEGEGEGEVEGAAVDDIELE